MQTEIQLNDIADELLILSKLTIDNLFKLENCGDCIALYIFYYKTAKWQKTNTIKANDVYVKQCLGWGSDKVRKTKKILKENGLIDIVQRRKDGKVQGWYVKVSYMVSQRKTEDIKIFVEDEQQHSNPTSSESNNTRNQQVGNPTSRKQTTNTLKDNNIYLKNNNKILKEREEAHTQSSTYQNLKKLKYGKYKNVLLTEEQYNDITEKWGEEKRDKAIAILDVQIETKGYKSKNHYATIIDGWVKDKLNELEQKQAINKPTNKFNNFTQRHYSQEQLNELEKRKLGVKEQEPIIIENFEEKRKQLQARLKDKYKKSANV